MKLMVGFLSSPVGPDSLPRSDLYTILMSILGKVVLLVLVVSATVNGSPYGAFGGGLRQEDAIVVEAPGFGVANDPVVVSNNPVSSGTNCIYRHYWDVASGSNTRQHYHTNNNRVNSYYDPPRNSIQSSSDTYYTSRQQPAVHQYVQNTRQTYQEPARVVMGSSYHHQPPVRDSTTYYQDDRVVAPVVSYGGHQQTEVVNKDSSSSTDDVKQSAYGIAPVRQTLKRDAEPDKDVTQQDSPGSSYESFWVQEGDRLIMGYRQVR